jgi:hypothetical protein
MKVSRSHDRPRPPFFFVCVHFKYFFFECLVYILLPLSLYPPELFTHLIDHQKNISFFLFSSSSHAIALIKGSDTIVLTRSNPSFRLDHLAINKRSSGVISTVKTITVALFSSLFGCRTRSDKSKSRENVFRRNILFFFFSRWLSFISCACGFHKRPFGNLERYPDGRRYSFPFAN